MEIDKYFFPLFLLDMNSPEKSRYIGNAFPVTPDGGLLTCRHVIHRDYSEGLILGTFDKETQRFVVITRSYIPDTEGLDMAFLPNALGREKKEFLPILSPEKLQIGEDVYTFGYFTTGGSRIADLERGYFKGAIAGFSSKDDFLTLTLPFALFEGMSGSPILTYHNGPKVVGIGYGNRDSRILAYEVYEYSDKDGHQKETIHRVAEFGLAYHAATIVKFLEAEKIEGYIVSDQQIGEGKELPGD